MRDTRIYFFLIYARVRVYSVYMLANDLYPKGVALHWSGGVSRFGLQQLRLYANGFLRFILCRHIQCDDDRS